MSDREREREIKSESGVSGCLSVCVCVCVCVCVVSHANRHRYRETDRQTDWDRDGQSLCVCVWQVGLLLVAQFWDSTSGRIDVFGTQRQSEMKRERLSLSLSGLSVRYCWRETVIVPLSRLCWQRVRLSLVCVSVCFQSCIYRWTDRGFVFVSRLETMWESVCVCVRERKRDRLRVV